SLPRRPRPAAKRARPAGERPRPAAERPRSVAERSRSVAERPPPFAERSFVPPRQCDLAPAGETVESARRTEPLPGCPFALRAASAASIAERAQLLLELAVERHLTGEI